MAVSALHTGIGVGRSRVIGYKTPIEVGDMFDANNIFVMTACARVCIQDCPTVAAHPI